MKEIKRLLKHKTIESLFFLLVSLYGFFIRVSADMGYLPANKPEYELIINRKLDISNSDSLPDPEHTVYTSNGQIIVANPIEDTVVIFKEGVNQQSVIEMQMLTDTGSTGIDVFESESRVNFLIVTGGQKDKLTLFKQEVPDEDWEEYLVFDNTTADKSLHINLASPHRAAFSSHGRYIVAISETKKELYILQRNLTSPYQWSPFKTISFPLEGGGNAFSRVEPLSEDHQFLLSSKEIIHQLDIEDDFILTPIITQSSFAPPVTFNPQELSVIDGQLLVLLSANEYVFFFTKNHEDQWLLKTRLSADNFEGQSFPIIKDLIMLKPDDDTLLLYVLTRDYLNVFAFSGDVQGVLYTQVLDRQALGFDDSISSDFTTISLKTTALKKETQASIAIISSATRSLRVLNNRQKPLFDQESYFFSYHPNNQQPENLKIGKITILFNTDDNEANINETNINETNIVDFDHGFDQDRLPFYWNNNTLFANSTELQLLKSYPTWSFNITAINKRSQMRTAPVDIHIDENHNNLPLLGLLGFALPPAIIAGAASIYRRSNRQQKVALHSNNDDDDGQSNGHLGANHRLPCTECYLEVDACHQSQESIITGSTVLPAQEIEAEAMTETPDHLAIDVESALVMAAFQATDLEDEEEDNSPEGAQASASGYVQQLVFYYDELTKLANRQQEAFSNYIKKRFRSGQ